VTIVVTEDATDLSVKCTQRPCYNAIVAVTPPSKSAGIAIYIERAGIAIYMEQVLIAL
jgi:hypothetical protein